MKNTLLLFGNIYKLVTYKKNMKKLQFNKKEKSVKVFGFEEVNTVDNNNLSEIQILKTGEFKHAMYGDFNITEKDLKQFEKNFKDKVRGIDLAVDVNHNFKHEGVGWFKEVTKRGKKLFATIEWNAEGIKLIKGKIFKYFSPELHFTYKDEETGKIIKNLLIGGGITNRPFFKGMQALKASEEGNSTEHYFFNLNDMSFKELFEKLKSKEKLSFSDSEAVRLAFSELSDGDQDLQSANLSSLESKFSEEEEVSTEGGEEEGAGEEGEEGEGEEEGGDDDGDEDGEDGDDDGEDSDDEEDGDDEGAGDGEGDGKSEFSEEDEKKFSEFIKNQTGLDMEGIKKMKKSFSIAESKILKTSVGNKLDKLMFSEETEKGVFSKEFKDPLVNFIIKLNKNLRKEFFEVLPSAMVKADMFKELGKEGKDAASKFSVSKETPAGTDRESHVLNTIATQYQESTNVDGKTCSFEDALEKAEEIIKDKKIK